MKINNMAAEKKWKAKLNEVVVALRIILFLAAVSVAFALVWVLFYKIVEILI
tara:strand:- start:2667 stop:2822 length:156 start_codon:yes stop_codon:yes gene_type:complete